ncbi:WD40 repeat domain-containing serine/threonine protein kinase [Stieleria neptunia]|nr:WD40 repeat domain-containing serine/threonine protein kinase [Stieleria neptunia]
MQIPCPSRKTLHDLLVGAVEDDQARAICRHLDTCSNCESLTSTLEQQHVILLQELQEDSSSQRYLAEPEFELLQKAISTSRSADCNTATKNDVAIAAGTRLRDYRLLKKIGQGGMGSVYLAVHLNLRKAFAVKVLPEEKLRSESSVARFRREMLAAGKVNHPNLISASDAGSVDGRHFLVMELVEGADLGRIVRQRGPLNVADACEIVRQAALGLQHAHDSGLLHRDIKPSNLMLTTDGNVKVLDLGLAGWVENVEHTEAATTTGGGLTHAGSFVGTPEYMAPEQFRSETPVDERADLYALGATLFQLLTGQTPQARHLKNRSAAVDLNLDARLVEIDGVQNDLPPNLQNYINRLLSPSPQQRPQTAACVALELSSFTEHSNLLQLAENCKVGPGMLSADLTDFNDIPSPTDLQPKRDRGPMIPQRSALPSLKVFLPVAAAAAIAIGLLLLFSNRTGFGVMQSALPEKDASVIASSPDQLVKEDDVVHAIRSGEINRAVSLARQLIEQAPNQGWNHALATMIAAYDLQADGQTSLTTYEGHRKWLGNRWAQTGEGTNTIPRICCLHPDPPADLSRMLDAVVAEAKGRPKDWRYPHSQMMLLFRLGRDRDALVALSDARRLSPNNVMHRAVDTAWSALILDRMGRSTEALRAFEKAQQLQLELKANAHTPVPQMWFDYIELVVILGQFDEQSPPPQEDHDPQSEPTTPQADRPAVRRKNALNSQAIKTEAADEGDIQLVQTPIDRAARHETRDQWEDRVDGLLIKQAYVDAEAEYAAGQQTHEMHWPLRCRVALGLMIAARDDSDLRPKADRYLQTLEQTLRNAPQLPLPAQVEILRLLALHQERQWDQALIDRIAEQVQGERWSDWSLHHCLATIRFRQGRLALALDHRAAAGQLTKSELQKWLHDYWWTLMLACNGQLDLARRSLMKSEMVQRQLTPLLGSESTASIEDLESILEMRWMMPFFQHRLGPLENLKRWHAGQTPAFVNLDNQIHSITKRLIESPDQAELHFQRAMTFSRMRRQREAFSDFQRAATLKPDDPIYQTVQAYVESFTKDRALLQQFSRAMTGDEATMLRRLDLRNPGTAFVFRVLLVGTQQEHTFSVYFEDLETLAKNFPDDWYCQYVFALWKLRTGQIDQAEAHLRSLVKTVDVSSLEQYCTLRWIDWLEDLRAKQSEEERAARKKQLAQLQAKAQFNPANVVKNWQAVYESMLISTGNLEPVRNVVEAELMRTIPGRGITIAFDLSRSGLSDMLYNINASALDPAGTRCAFTPLRDGSLYLLEIAQGKLVNFPAGGEVRCLEFTGDGKSLIVGRPNKCVDVIEIATRRATSLNVKYQPNSLDHCETGNLLAVAFQAKRVEIWDLATKTLWQQPTLLLGVPRHIEFNADGSRIAIGMGNDHTSLYSQTLAPVTELSDGGQFAWIDHNTICCYRSDSRQLRIIDIDKERQAKPLATTPGSITALTYLKSHQLIVTGNDRGEVMGWSLSGEQKMIGHLPHALIRRLSSSDDGRYLLATGRRHRQGDGGSCCVLFDLAAIEATHGK